MAGGNVEQPGPNVSIGPAWVEPWGSGLVLAWAARCVVIGSSARCTVAPESVSFRISRNAEDLAHTVHALSQRLVKLEQRLEALELQLDRQVERDPQEISSLDNVERLLLDCRALLEMAEPPEDVSYATAA
jgi:hypothetical protein